MDTSVRRRCAPAIALTALFLLIVAGSAPAMAASKPQPTGERINLFSGDQSYPAATPFHIKQGFGYEVPFRFEGFGKLDFTLDVDGTARAVDFRTTETLGGTAVLKWWNFNFPNGMTGTHTFIGHFWAPCGGPVFPCNGQPPNTVMEAGSLTVTVTFS